MIDKLKSFLEKCLERPKDLKTFSFQSTLEKFGVQTMTELLHKTEVTVEHFMPEWDAANYVFNYKGMSFTCYCEKYEDGWFEIKPYLLQ